MTDTRDIIQDMIAAVAVEDYTVANTKFEDAFALKAAEQLDVTRKEVAQRMFNGENES